MSEEASLKRIAQALENIYKLKKEYADSQRKVSEPMTEKQRGYLNILLDKMCLSSRFIQDNLSKREASEFIHNLSRMLERDEKFKDQEKVGVTEK